MSFLVSLLVPLLAQHPLHSFYGDTPGDKMGFGVSTAGDVDGDGHADLLVGAKHDDRNGLDSGSAFVYSGADGSLLYVFSGDDPGDELGAYVNEAGDVNADGRGDVIVGIHFADPSGPYSGAARVYSGADGTILHTFVGDAPYDFFGQSVCGPGDVNLDGFDDLLVGARESEAADPGPGYARLYSGFDGSALLTVSGEDDFDWFGKFVGAPGDVDLDGYPDLLVGAKGDDDGGNEAGSARVYSGFDGRVLLRWDGFQGSWFGTSVNGAGDVNADGHPDVIIGAYRSRIVAPEAGSLFVYSGSDGELLYAYHGFLADDWYGKNVDGLGDVDRDGYDDFAAAGYHSDYNGIDTGLVRVYSGRDGAVLYSFVGEQPRSHFGYWVNGAGDVNADGTPDLIVGANADSLGGAGAGAAHVFSLGTLVLAAPVPGQAGLVNRVELSGATPGGRVFFAYATAPGLSLASGCEPGMTSLAEVRLLGAEFAGASGGASWLGAVPLAAQGIPLWFQAVDFASCTVSNLVPFVFE